VYYLLINFNVLESVIIFWNIWLSESESGKSWPFNHIHIASGQLSVGTHTSSLRKMRRKNVSMPQRGNRKLQLPLPLHLVNGRRSMASCWPSFWPSASASSAHVHMPNAITMSRFPKRMTGSAEPQIQKELKVKRGQFTHLAQSNSPCVGQLPSSKTEWQKGESVSRLIA